MQEITRIIPKQKCEDWPLKLNRMAQLYFETEYQTVKQGVRKAAIVSLSLDSLDKVLEKINKDRLIFIPMRKIKKTPNFVFKVEQPKRGELFDWLGYLVKDREDGDILKKAQEANDHLTIGQMLGYPDCCTKYFMDNFPINYDPIWVNEKGKVSGYPECNGLLRYFGPKIVPHYSCSPTCEKTREMGQVWFKIMKDIDRKLAEEMYELLSGPITWDSYHGIAQVETPYFIGLVNTFSFLEKPKVIKWQAKKKFPKKKSSKKNNKSKKGEK